MRSVWGRRRRRPRRASWPRRPGWWRGTLALAGYADSIHRDEAGQVQFHYTILDFCTRIEGGAAPVAGGDAAAVVWAALDRLADYALWDEIVRMIEISRGLLLPER